MMTPYRSAENNSREANYNSVHSKCRSIIERCFGVLKGRFRCLLQSRELHYQPEKAARIINVCAMLHNMCIEYNVDFDQELYVQNVETSCSQVPNCLGTNITIAAKTIRDQIKNSL